MDGEKKKEEDNGDFTWLLFCGSYFVSLIPSACVGVCEEEGDGFGMSNAPNLQSHKHKLICGPGLLAPSA